MFPFNLSEKNVSKNFLNIYRSSYRMGKIRFIVIELWYMHLNFLTAFSFPMHAIQYTNNTVIVRKK